MVDVGPVLGASFVMNQKMRAGIDVVRSMQRELEDVLVGVDIEGRHSFGADKVDLEGGAGLVSPGDDGRGGVCANGQDVCGRAKIAFSGQSVLVDFVTGDGIQGNDLDLETSQHRSV
jgi:hypothetical protein